MSRCLIDFEGEECPVLRVNAKEKFMQCAGCFAKCTTPKDLKERFTLPSRPNGQADCYYKGLANYYKNEGEKDGRL